MDALSKINVGTTADWRAAGLSEKQLAALVRAGDLVRIRFGAYATARILAAAETDPRLGHAVHVAAAAARIDGAVASHHSAARIWGLGMLHEPPTETVTITVPPGAPARRSERAGVIRHTAELPVTHMTKMYGVRITTEARTVADIARSAPFMEGVVVAESALYDRRTSKTELRRVLASCERWPGVARARQVIDFSNSLSESVLESCARVLLREQGLPPPEQQVNVLSRTGRFVARVDFFWPQYFTAAEADGLLKYQERADAIAQLQRDRLLRDAGYEVVHFTWHELFGNSAAVAGRIRTAFDRATRLTR